MVFHLVLLRFGQPARVDEKFEFEQRSLSFGVPDGAFQHHLHRLIEFDLIHLEKFVVVELLACFGQPGGSV